ncbi:MAG: hypothetical protein HZB51_24310 [Chloroflexi bacterium]|nr:hypothetical protein [Chloroflexota bacterium]
MLSSLYLTAFEVLKIAIIEPIKGFFSLTPQKYENEVGIKFDEAEQYALISSCLWLQKNGALTNDEVDEIKSIREHRNEIAHELPNLIASEGSEIRLDLFKQMRELLRKIDIFWARADIFIELETLEVANTQDVRDEDILSSREIILDMITQTVTAYLEQRASSKQ